MRIGFLSSLYKMNEHRADQGRDRNPNGLIGGWLLLRRASDVCQCVALETAAMCSLSLTRAYTRTLA